MNCLFVDFGTIKVIFDFDNIHFCLFATFKGANNSVDESIFYKRGKAWRYSHKKDCS
jgi:hypothetical protein